MGRNTAGVKFDMDDFWVFGYGSLMWNPGFIFEERQAARLHGYRRALCIRSNVYRGTVENPGLVLGLERGGSCHGVAFRVVYKEKSVPISFADGRKLKAVTYVADPKHDQYVSGLNPYDAAQIIAQASGSSGPNEDYVVNTIAHLKAMEIRDLLLEEIVDEICTLQSASLRKA
jgi:cation transport protein ChaC